MFTPVTPETVNEDAIETLSYEAAAAGDFLGAAICRRALGEGPDSYAGYAMRAEEREEVDSMSKDEALNMVCMFLQNALAAAA